jgi:hypothetical protein
MVFHVLFGQEIQHENTYFPYEIRFFTSSSHLNRGTKFHLLFETIIVMNTDYQKCIESCMACITACHHCASVCLEENPEKFAGCIRQNMKCGTICFATVQMMTLGSEQADELCLICAEVCNACAAECANYRNNDCIQCARACLKCAEACRSMHSEQGMRFWMLN